MIDLGAWAAEDYKVGSEPLEPEGKDEDQE